LKLLDLEGTKPLALISKHHLFAATPNKENASFVGEVSPEKRVPLSQLKRGLIQSQYIDHKAEKSLEALDRTMKTFDSQWHLNEVYGRKNIQEFSGKYRDLVIRTKNRIKDRD
jgi:hypothetical protein